MANLADVARLARESRDADQALRAAVAAAHGAGASVTDLATAADVTRQTIYRWVATETGEMSGRPEDALREAIYMLARFVRPDQAKQLTSRAGGSPMSQLMALQMGRSWLPPDASREMTDEERAILAMAADAEERLQRKRG